jgi:hypothetical protein
LGQADFCQDNLANGHVATGKLPNPHQESPSKLGQGRKADNELAEAEDQAHPELGYRNNPNRKLADGDETFGHLKFPLSVFTKSNMNQGVAIKRLTGAPLETWTLP